VRRRVLECRKVIAAYLLTYLLTYFYKYEVMSSHICLCLFPVMLTTQKDTKCSRRETIWNYFHTTKNNILFVDISASHWKPVPVVSMQKLVPYVAQLVAPLVSIHVVGFPIHAASLVSLPALSDSRSITGSQSWWRLPLWSRNVDKQYIIFGCVRVISYSFSPLASSNYFKHCFIQYIPHLNPSEIKCLYVRNIDNY